jgi:hypothetical protein
MTTPTSNNQDVEGFKALYPGYSKAHGTSEIRGIDPKTRKRKAAYTTEAYPASDRVWAEHLSGGPKGLGIIPLLDDGESVKWAAIDIDVNDIDHASLEKKVEDLGLPLVICRSKSGGAHCYLFLEKSCLAKDVVDALNNWSAALGHPGVEIFPKQTRRALDQGTGKPGPGNWINLPYFGADNTERYCIYRGGRLSLQAFVELAEANRAGQSALKVRYLTTTDPEIALSPKSREGRNGYLFSRACSMRKTGMADSEICEAIIVINQLADQESCPNFIQGPLPKNEVAAICKSAMSERYAPVQNGFKDAPYFIFENQLVRREHKIKGHRDITLCNFTAEIVEDICRDDGAGEVREYQLKARLYSGEPLPSVTVPASRYNSMGWVPDAFGARALITVGMTNQQHTAAAIQYLSSPLQRLIYTHTGWREINGRWHFLHGAGAITAGGYVSGIEVDLGRGLLNYQLPDPQSGDTQAAIRASIELLDIAPDHIIWPLLASVFRSVLSEWLPAELSVFVVGPTGTFKTCLAAVCTSYFGKGWTGSNTPASWSSTANALERMAFTAKDHLLLIDDFAPNGTSTDINKLHATAERVIRAQGNQAGRFRMRADSTLAGSLPPRGLIVATGEDLPRGQSLQARLVVVQIAPGDINISQLTEAQACAENGTYALAMAAFTQRLARLADAGKLSSRLDSRHKELRAEAIKGSHTRMPDNIASLMVGVEEFLDFAAENTAIAETERSALRASAWAALSKQANMQASQVAGTDPASRFVSLIAAAVSAKSANIAGINGGPPVRATALGWDHRGSGQHTYLYANGRTIGWIEADDLYLEPEEAMACAKHLAREQGTELSLTDRRIQKALQEAGLLKSSEPERNTIRKTLHGRRRNVLHLSAETVLGIDPRSNATPPKPVELNDEDLPF